MAEHRGKQVGLAGAHRPAENEALGRLGAGVAGGKRLRHLLGPQHLLRLRGVVFKVRMSHYRWDQSAREGFDLASQGPAVTGGDQLIGSGTDPLAERLLLGLIDVAQTAAPLAVSGALAHFGAGAIASAADQITLPLARAALACRWGVSLHTGFFTRNGEAKTSCEIWPTVRIDARACEQGPSRPDPDRALASSASGESREVVSNLAIHRGPAGMERAQQRLVRLRIPSGAFGAAPNPARHHFKRDVQLRPASQQFGVDGRKGQSGASKRHETVLHPLFCIYPSRGGVPQVDRKDGFQASFEVVLGKFP